MSPGRLKRVRRMRHALQTISVSQAEIATIRAPGIGTIDPVAITAFSTASHPRLPCPRTT
ncbi:hypothetical protein HNQ01_002147 [Leptothrix sp. C29]|uniref:Uncharacterized protein n=1 Tax=Sphaerotilus uruguayifluvii TaxID=2735897 RepID=A0ABX2G2A7_9BURK|nr:hypothetical protein [Leptothrix sp. C29]